MPNMVPLIRPCHGKETSQDDMEASDGCRREEGLPYERWSARCQLSWEEQSLR